MSAPTDSNFYLELAKRFSSFGKPEDFLWIWSSENGLDPTLSGNSRTIAAMMKYVAVPRIMTDAEWSSLPTLSATDQLPFIQKLYQITHDQIGRKFQDTFEVYLANAASGLLRVDGRYNPSTVMYGSPDAPAGNVWAANWLLDNYPVGITESTARGVKLSLDFGKQLVSEGKLKGWISLGDLKKFGSRNTGNEAIANDAINRLHNALLTAEIPPQEIASQSINVPVSYVAAGSPGGYQPDFSKSFSDPNAPPDVRVAPQPSSRSILSLKEVLILGAFGWIFWRYLLK